MSGSQDPPPRPWRRGKHENYSCASLEVRIVEDALGWVFSEHVCASPEDEKVVSEMRGHGLKQVAYALMTEALRREVYLCLLVEMSKHEDMLRWYAEGDETYQAKFRERLAGAALATIMGLVQKMLPDISREVIEMGVSQLGGSENPPGE